MADPNFLSAAQEQTLNQRKALLAAMAQDGARAKAAYDAQLADQQATRKAQLDRMLAESATRSIPATAVNRVTQLSGEGNDLRTRALSDAQASQQRLMEGISAANSAYMDQVNAAAPLIAQMAAARKAQADRVAADKAASTNTLSDAELSKRLIGAARMVRDEAKNNAATAQATFPGVKNSDGTDGAGLTGGRALDEYLHQQAAITGRSEEDIARELGIGAGFDPARVFGVVPNPPAPKAPKVSSPKTANAKIGQKVGLSETSVTRVRKSPTYSKALTLIDQLRQPPPLPPDATKEQQQQYLLNPPKGMTTGQIRAYLRSQVAEYDRFPKTFEVAIADALGG